MNSGDASRPRTGRQGGVGRRVVFYWRPGCPFCWMLRRGLHRADVTLEERIWEDPGAAAFVRSVAGGNETVPTVAVDGRARVNPSVSAVLALLGPSGEREPSAPRRGLLRRLLGGPGPSALP